MDLGKPISCLHVVKLESQLTDNLVFSIGLLLAIAGFVVGILVFIIAIAKSMRGSGKVRGGGVVMIGPVPIIFGTDKQSTRTLVLLAIVLMLVFLLLTMLPLLWR